MHLESLNCYRGSTSLRKEERPFLSGDGEESFSTTFSHPTGQILIRVLFSASGASSSSAPGTMQGCSFLPWDTGCWLWWSPCWCLCCSEQRCSPNRSVLGSFSSPTVASLALACQPHNAWWPYAEWEGKDCSGLKWPGWRGSENIHWAGARKFHLVQFDGWKADHLISV